MATNLTGLKVKDTYNSLLKIGDNSSLSATPDKISDGLGNESILYLSTSQVSIGTLPATGYDLTVNSATKTGSLDVVGAATAASLRLTGGSGSQGTLSWNTDEETVDIIQNGAVLQLGQEMHVHVKNQTGSTINDGTPVYVTGTLGASGRLTVAPMIADGSIEAKYFLGVTTEDIPNGEDGKVTTFGKIRGLDTTAYTEGQTLYVSASTAGFWQTTAPVAPALDLEAAIVINVSANNGTIFVRAQQGHYLGMLHDVYISSPANNQFLVYNSTTSRWENQGIASVGSINLDSVTDNGNTTTNDISVGDITAGNMTLSGYLRGAGTFVIDPSPYADDAGVVQILGDLRVDGTTTTINSTTVTIDDKNIVLASGSATAADANGAGITIDGASATMTYVSASDRFVFNKNIETDLVGDVTGNLTGNADTASALETARNIAVDGAVTGNADFDGSANITITTSVNHNHDDRYYTETEADTRFVNVDGDTMTGDLNFDSGSRVRLHSGAFTDANDRYEIFATGDVMFLQYWDNDQGNGTSLQKVVLSLDGTTSQREATLFGDLRLKSGNVASPTYDAVVLDIDKVNGHVDITNVRNGSFSGDLTATTNLIVGTTNVYDNLPTGISWSKTDNRFKIGVTTNGGGTTETAIDDLVLATSMDANFIPYVSSAGGDGDTVNAVLSQSWLKLNSDTLEIGNVSDPFSVDSKIIKISRQIAPNEKQITEFKAQGVFVTSTTATYGTKNSSLQFYTNGRLNVNGAYTLPEGDGTSGQVLTTNGSGDLSWAAASGGSIDLQEVTDNGATTTNSITVGGKITVDSNTTDSSDSTWYSATNSRNDVTITNGTDLYFKKLYGSSSYASYVYYPEEVGLNFDISFKLTLPNSSSYRHFAIAIASDGGEDGTQFDYIVFRDNATDSALRQIRIDVAGTSESSLVGSSLPAFADGTERHVLIQVRNRDYNIEVEGVQVHKFTASARTRSRGVVGFSIYETTGSDTYANVRQFQITQYAHDVHLMPDIKIGGTEDGASSYGVYLQNNKWYATQYSPSHDVVRINANTVGWLDVYNDTDAGFTGINVGDINILDSAASSGILKMGGVTTINASRQGIFQDIKVESGSSNSIRIGDGFGSGGSATIHNYQKPLFLQYNNGVASGGDATTYIGGGGTTSDLNLIGGGNIVLTGRILMNRDGLAGDAIDINHVENSDWSFVFRSSSVGNDNDSGFWVNSDGTPDMRLRATDATVKALIHSNGDSYINGGSLAVGLTSAGNVKFKVEQSATWDGSNYAIEANTYSNFGGVRINGGDTSRSILQQINGAMGIATQFAQPIVFLTSNTIERARIQDSALNTLSVQGSGYFNGVRLGRDFSIADRATLRLDANGANKPSDILFGHTPAANQTSWTGVEWSLSSRGTSAGNKFYFYRGGGQPAPYNSEAIIMAFHPSLQVDVNGDLYFGKGADPRIYANTGVGLNIDGEALYLNRNTSATVAMVQGGGNVGIGTNITNGKLSVKAATFRQLDFVEEDSRMTIKSTAPDASFNIRPFSISASDIAFKTGSTGGTTSSTQMFIAGSGNVGIGTASPSGLTSGVNSLSLGGTNATTSGGLFHQVNGVYKAYQWADTTHGLNYNAISLGYRWMINGGTQMTLFNNGRLSINTGVNQAPLNVDSDMLVRSANVGAEHGIFFRENFVTSNKYNIGIMAYDHNGSFPDGLTFAAYDGLSFCTGANTRQERMRVQLNGNVGVGSAALTTTNIFQAKGAFSVDSGALFNTAAGQMIIAEYAGGSTPVPFAIRNSTLGGDTSNSFGTLHIDRIGAGVGGGSNMYFRRTDSAGVWREYAGLGGVIGSATTGSYGGYLNFYVSNNGSARLNYARLDQTGNFHVESDVIAYSTTVSDARLKDDVQTIDNALDKVKALRGVEYVWNKGGREGQKDLGFIAQEVEQVIPEIVREKEMPLLDDSGEQYKTVDYEKVVAVLVEAVKDQQKQIDELKARLDGSTK